MENIEIIYSCKICSKTFKIVCTYFNITHTPHGPIKILISKTFTFATGSLQNILLIKKCFKNRWIMKVTVAVNIETKNWVSINRIVCVNYILSSGKFIKKKQPQYIKGYPQMTICLLLLNSIGTFQKFSNRFWKVRSWILVKICISILDVTKVSSL